MRNEGWGSTVYEQGFRVWGFGPAGGIGHVLVGLLFQLQQQRGVWVHGVRKETLNTTNTATMYAPPLCLRGEG